MTDTDVAISWTLVIMAGFFIFLGIFVAKGSLERIEFLVAGLMSDFVALGMFIQQVFEERKKK